ncbi:MAG: rnr [Candidatus Parcubacteria bacterium]|nr:rnr [Candidatus Parcubacteria bacterium]
MSGQQKEQLVIGSISTIAKGAGFLDDPDPTKESIYIEPGFLNTALNNDTVEVRVENRKMRGVMERVGVVTRVIERAKTAFVGTIDTKPGGAERGDVILIPDDKRMYTSILIPAAAAAGLVDGLKVYVEIDFASWKDAQKRPTGKVIRILGKKGVNDVEMESIVLEKGFAVGFPPEVEREAREIGTKGKIITAEEIADRRDMRTTQTFTIDPFDAKDFDDAISFKELPGAGGDAKRYEIGVHIADVSHYVREGSALDKEAVKRGCSVYLVDRTIPMLPEVLSNDVCSLNPHEDKLSFSAIFVMNDKAEILERWFGRTIMNSTHRYTYETAQSAIDGTTANIDKYSNGIQTAASAEAGMHYRDSLIILNRIAKILQKNKFAEGAIEFEQEEVKFKLDAEGRPIGVYTKPRLDTHKLVEEYMLLANREVARFIFDEIKKKGTRDTGAIYRIHDSPDKEKIGELATFVKALGYDLQLGKDGAVTARGLNSLLEQIEGTAHESLIRTATIRSMQKAIYSTKNIGHFGLAFDFYTHFTSPIRRYPDLLVHRVLAKHLANQPFGDKDIVNFQHIAETSTDREIDAAEAERASKKLKQVEYMATRIGQTFTGTISGVTKWGMYVEEDISKSEGMINFKNLGDDYWVFDQKTYSVHGERSKKTYTLGDKVTFKVMSADLDKKVLDYSLQR